MAYLRSLRIRGFRSLDDLSFQDFARINLLVGQNNVGKTSVLEAIWLLHSPSNLLAPQALTAFRGSDLASTPLEAIWPFLFYGADPRQPVQVAATDQEGAQHTLKLTLRPATTIQLETREVVATAGITSEGTGNGVRVAPIGSGVGAPLAFEVSYQRNQEEPVVSTAMVSGSQLKITTPPLASSGLATFLFAGGRVNATLLSQWFTLAQESGKLDQLLVMLRVFEPRLRTLTIGVAPGSTVPHLRGDVGLHRPLPLELFGAGMAHLVAIVLGIFNTPGGVLLADEVENGVYHENLEELWRAVELASREAHTQLFVTTHSYECLRAAVRAFVDHPDDLRVYRLERCDEATRVVAMQYDQVQAAVLEFHSEVR